MFARAVKHTSDLVRIQNLPRRELSKDAAVATAARLTPTFARHGGVSLMPWQGACLDEFPRTGGGIGSLPVGIGKAQPDSEPVLTPDGWREIGSLQVGDLVFGSAGLPVRVTGVFPQGEREIARLDFTGGGWTRCDYEHLWTFRNAGSDSQVQTRTLREWVAFGLDRPCGAHRAHKLFLPVLAPVQLPEAELPIDPYTLGALLGDGSLSQSTINFTTMDPDILRALVLPEGVRARPTKHQNSGRATQYNLSQEKHKRGPKYPNPLTRALRELGLVKGTTSSTKFVPDVYLRASVAQRTALLQGLLDTDGGCAGPGGHIEYSTLSDELAQAVCDLVEGLGGTCRRGPNSANGNYRLGLKIPRTIAPYRCARKRVPYDTQRPQRQAPRALHSVTHAGREHCTCISVDAPDHLYVTRHHVLTHNTLLIETLPMVMRSTKSVLILPASLKQKTFGDRRKYAADWRTANPPPRIITREELAIEANAFLLEQIDPDLILIDEAHKLRNADSSAVRRIDRFVRTKRAAGRAKGLPWPHGVAVVALTGTLSRRSILGYWHILLWCLGESAPVPLARAEAELWADAIDDASPRQGFRPDTGALGATIERAREWYRDRLTETPGVVVVDEDSAGDVPLSISIELAPDCPVIDQAFVDIRTLWQSPTGEPLSDPLSLMRVEGQSGSGYVTYWDPPPPPRWVDARRGVAKFIRERIAATRHSRKPLDTDAQVMRAHADHPAVVEWKKVAKSFDPLKNSKVKWISDETREWARDWLLATDEPSVLWCGGVEFADRLSRETRIPYFGPKGEEVRTGQNLHAVDVRRTPRLICSWHACREGQNLQDWRRQGIIQPPQSAEALEQIFGRPHRQGQTEPVHFTILATSGGTLDGFAAAISEAEFTLETAQHTQKILRATIEPLPVPPTTLRWLTR